MRVVVTGASGRVGTALLRRFAARPDLDVLAVTRRPLPRDAWFSAVAWHALDLADAAAPVRLRHVCTGADVVVHLAWTPPSVRDLEYVYKVDVGGSTAVVEAAHDAGVGHLVHMSSAGVYAPAARGRLVDETWPTAWSPSSSFSRTKVAVETQLDDYDAQRPRMVTTRVRPGLVVDGSTSESPLRPGRFPSPAVWPTAVASVVDADDVADALVRIIDGRHAGAFNLAAGAPITGRRLAALLGGRPGWADVVADTPLVDSTRARDVLGWACDLSAGAGFGATRSADPAAPGTRP